MGGNSSGGPRPNRDGRQPGEETAPPPGIGAGFGIGAGADDPTDPTDPADDATTHDSHDNDAYKNFRRDETGVEIDVADLVDRVKNGEREAFGALYDQYAELVYRFVFYRVGSVQLTEDIVSETFLKALRRIGSFTWQGPDIGAWFITIARHLVIDHVRSSKTRLEFPTEDILTAAETHSDGTASGPEDTVITMLRNRTLLEAVRALSPDQQECVVLRFLEGLSLRETALAMGRKENAVKALQLRAVRALARHLPPPSELI